MRKYIYINAFTRLASGRDVFPGLQDPHVPNPKPNVGFGVGLGVGTDPPQAASPPAGTAASTP